LLIVRDGRETATLAPHLFGFLVTQSDFGHPLGAALPTQSPRTSPLRTFPQNLACGATHGSRTQHAIGFAIGFAIGSAIGLQELRPCLHRHLE
jgi:hypothetical protein